MREVVTPDFIKEYIQKCVIVTSRSTQLHHRLLNKYSTPEIQEWFEENKITPAQVRYLIDHNTNQIPVCKICGKELLHYEKQNQDRFCSLSCSKKSEEVIEKTKQTCIKRYGVSSYSKSDDFKERAKATNLERYGVDNPMKNKEIAKKASESIQSTYSDIEKREEIRTKAKETSIKRYGCESPNQSEEVKNKKKASYLERYAVENPRYLSIDKRIETQRGNYYDTFIQKLSDKNISLDMTKEEYLTAETIRYKCLKCGSIFESISGNPQKVCCEKCSKLISNPEKEMRDFISSVYDGEILTNVRGIIGSYELDVYIPEKQVAFEFNGDYWHSSVIKDVKYHQKKTLACRNKGIRLIHIFEYEWKAKRSICESIIRSSLNSYDLTVYARKCVVLELYPEDYKDFLNENHLQGAVNSSIRYGLYYRFELVAVIGFGKSRFKKDEFELHRFCLKKNVKVIGGFSKLISHSKVRKFISYIDLSHFSGEGYTKLGFKTLELTEPNYKWVKDDIVLNRFATQKHKLSFLLEKYDSGKTERENMSENGFYQIFDSGNLKVLYESC